LLAGKKRRLKKNRELDEEEEDIEQPMEDVGVTEGEPPGQTTEN